MATGNPSRRQAAPSRRRFLAMAVATLAAGCAGMQAAPPDPRRAAVDRLFSRLQQDFKSDRWDTVAWAFSPDFRDDTNFRHRWEERWTRHRTVEIQMVPGRILEAGGLLNVQVRWNRTTRNANGQFLQGSGSSEFILEPAGNEFRIRQILGRPFP